MILYPSIWFINDFREPQNSEVRNFDQCADLREMQKYTVIWYATDEIVTSWRGQNDRRGGVVSPFCIQMKNAEHSATGNCSPAVCRAFNWQLEVTQMFLKNSTIIFC